MTNILFPLFKENFASLGTYLYGTLVHTLTTTVFVQYCLKMNFNSPFSPRCGRTRSFTWTLLVTLHNTFWLSSQHHLTVPFSSGKGGYRGWMRTMTDMLDCALPMPCRCDSTFCRLRNFPLHPRCHDFAIRNRTTLRKTLIQLNLMSPTEQWLSFSDRTRADTQLLHTLRR